jgi:hypothetical protein
MLFYIYIFHGAALLVGFHECETPGDLRDRRIKISK